ncbi:unnamed protein product [Discosporangium mesarthrocarpum]
MAKLSAMTSGPKVPFLCWMERTVKERANVQDVFGRWFDSDGAEVEARTFKGLWVEAGRIAHELRVTRGLEKGDRVILCYSFGLNFFAAFLGCLRAGIIAVPVYPPSPSTLSKSLRKLQGIVDSCKPCLILISQDVDNLRLASRLNFLSDARRLWPSLPYHCLAVDPEAGGSSGGIVSTAISWAGVRGSGYEASKDRATAETVVSFDEEALVSEDVAFLQFTSGSTAEPKGVMITLGNLSSNVSLLLHGNGRAMGAGARGSGVPAQPVGFSWLPQYHDLG